MNKQDFIEKTIKRRQRKHFKVSNSFGVYDVYKLIRKHKWYDIGRPLKEQEFYKIIRSINKYLAEELTSGQDVVFPERMGKLELRKREAGVSITEGKLKVTYPVDWKKTLSLWYEDTEARENKTLIRNMSGTVYRVRYLKGSANYNNKSFYKFTLCRTVKEMLKEKIQNRETDSLWEEVSNNQ